MIREELRDLKDFPVYPGTPKAKMDQNETPYPLPAAIPEALKERVSSMPFHRYLRPERITELKRALSGYSGVSPESIAVGAGADAMIQTLIALFAIGRGAVFHFHPSYPLYSLFAQVLGVPVKTLFLEKEDFDFDLDKAQEILEGCAVAFIANPNNPTGNLFRKDKLKELIESHPRCQFVLDEAYFEYAGETWAGEVNRHENLCVIRTFSKLFSIPSLRLGYLIGRPDMVSVVEKAQFVPYNVSGFSVEAGLILLEERPLFQEIRGKVIRERSIMESFLCKFSPVVSYPSYGNFLFMRFPPGENPAEALFKEGVYVRDYGGVPGYEDFIRITLGGPEENLLFRETLQKLFNHKEG
ncbi:MAG TPA: histidinol-phosphate transaminase [Candidatus Mcinerneyibacteriales bacterium]|nr:histidinol-phosphate transaminase [Candidatus Mcinerneyibacteriales bacterium]